MYLYTMLPGTYTPSVMIDRYRSFIWTERYNTAGDFELVLELNRQNSTMLPLGTLIGCSESTRVMVVESIEELVDADELGVLTVKGRSLEIALLSLRAAMPRVDSSTQNPWMFYGTPQQIMRDVFAYSCGLNALNTFDTLPDLVNQADPRMYQGTLPFPEDEGWMEISRTDVYSVLTQIATNYRLGFRLTHYNSKISFDVYTGHNRSSSQHTFPAMIFDKKLNTMINGRTLLTSSEYKNIAYVYSKYGFEAVTLPTRPTGHGFNRRIMVVDATDIETDLGPDLNTELEIRGREALLNQNYFVGFDGEIPGNSPYSYGTDYNLGDLVEYRDDLGRAFYVLVTEQIFSSDETGTKSYPTLSSDTQFQAGTWEGWDALQVWPDAPGVWSDH